MTGVSPPITNPYSPQTVPERRRSPEGPALQPPRQDNAHKVSSRDHGAGHKRQQTVKDGAGVDVAPHALPLDAALRLWKRGGGEPPHAELERQRVANHQPLCVASFHVGEGARRVGRRAVEDPAVVGVDVLLGRRVQQDVHVGADVHVAQLQRARQREDERHVLLLGRLKPDDFDVRRRPRGQPAGQGRVGVDVELEQVEEGVRDHGYRAVFLLLDAVREGERGVGFVARREGDPLDLVRRRVWERDVLACFSVGLPQTRMLDWEREELRGVGGNRRKS